MKRDLFLNGLPDLLVLRLLSQGEKYGYEIVGQIRNVGGDALQFGEGCIYPLLHRLVAQGHVLQRSAMVSGRQRHYYRLSASGKRQLAEVNERWKTVTKAVNQIEFIS